MSATASRRVLLGTSAAMLLAGAFEAGATKADELDRDILDASREWLALEAEYNRICIDADQLLEPRKTEVATRLAVIADEQEGLMAVLEETPARTPEGLRAKAAALREYIPHDHEGPAAQSPEYWLAWSLCSDLIGRA